MMILLSPTKQMDFTSSLTDTASVSMENEEVHFKKEAAELNQILQTYNREELASLMKISPSLTDQTYNNIHEFASSSACRRSAIFAYSGTVFQAISPQTLNTDQLCFAQNHLRILSGIYGILSPFSLINGYRLEMKTALKLPGNESLISYWRPRISQYLNTELSGRNEDTTVLNLASGEYSRVIDKKALRGKLITFHFKEKNGDKLKTVGMYAKIARGLMLRRILLDKVIDLQLLQKGQTGGYRFNEVSSTETDWIFVRNTVRSG